MIEKNINIKETLVAWQVLCNKDKNMKKQYSLEVTSISQRFISDNKYIKILLMTNVKTWLRR